MALRMLCRRAAGATLAVLVTIATLAAGATPARADDAVLGRSGETVVPLTDQEIRMADETVVLTLDEMRTLADLTFTFTNDGPARTILMGFPVGKRSDMQDEADLGNDLELHDFKAWVDGAPVEVKRETGGPSPGGSGSEYAAWITWPVSFAAGETRVVRNTYWGSDSAWSNGDVRVGYILKTGAAWKGPIGHAVIRVRPNFLPVDPFRVYPTDYRWDGNDLVWEWRNFEPRADIEVAWNSRPVAAPADWDTLMKAIDQGVPQGAAAYLQEYRRTHPNPNAPDAIDMALALWLHQSGDQAGASAIVQRALTAQVQHPYVPYLAVEEGLRQPAEVLGWTMNPALRRWFQDRAGLEGEPPDLPVITFPERPDSAVAWINVHLADPDEDLNDWGVRVWASSDESMAPLIDARCDPADPGSLSRPDLILYAPGWLTVDRVWARAWVEDGRGHRRETPLVELTVPAGVKDPSLRPAPEQPSPATPPSPDAEVSPSPQSAPQPAGPIEAAASPHPLQLLAYGLSILFAGAALFLVVIRLHRSGRRRLPR
ncbi:MAG: hypothetical protein ACYC5Y_13410 [Symbiobacteriia bacterium]